MRNAAVSLALPSFSTVKIMTLLPGKQYAYSLATLRMREISYSMCCSAKRTIDNKLVNELMRFFKGSAVTQLLLLTKVAGNFITEDASRAVYLSHNVGQFTAGKYHLFGFLAD